MNFDEVLINRSSIRGFKNTPIEESSINQIVEHIISAPSAGNLQAYKIYIIKNKQVLSELTEASLNQDSICKSNITFVFCALPKESAKEYGKRGETLYALQDATIAASYCQLAVTNQKLASVWIGAFDDEKVAKILNLPKTEVPVAIIPVGKPNEITYPTSRKSIDNVISWIE